MTDESRRAFLKRLPAASTGFALALSANAAAQQSAKHDGVEKLKASGFDFIGNDGKLIDLNALEQKTAHGLSSLSFMFNGCSVKCVRTAPELAKAMRQHTTMQFIVVSVDPPNDYPGLQKFLADLGMTNNVTILYPIQKLDATHHVHRLLSQEEAAHIETDQFKELILGMNRSGHDASVKIYNDGNLAKKVVWANGIASSIDAVANGRGAASR